MWLTSNTPTLARTALCSATNPPVDGYSTGISQPPKSTILAPSARCTAFNGVLRSLTTAESAKDSPGSASSLSRALPCPRRIPGRDPRTLYYNDHYQIRGKPVFRNQNPFAGN